MTRFPPGKYYVGDLCYVIKDWDKFCDMTSVGDSVLDGHFAWEGKFLWTHGTAYGDGTYLDNHGREYAVDAGLIGVIPADLITKDNSNGCPIEDLGQILEFIRPFECSYEDGKFYIGDDVVIDTDPSYDDGYEDEDESEDE